MDARPILLRRAILLSLVSGALRADALLTAAAALLAGVSLVSIHLATTTGIWWADAFGALVIAAIVARERPG